jgi:hypothetical protein
VVTGGKKEGRSFFFGAIAQARRMRFGDSVLSSSAVPKILPRELGSSEPWFGRFALLHQLLVCLTSERSGHRVLLLQLKLTQKACSNTFVALKYDTLEAASFDNAEPTLRSETGKLIL